MPARTWRIIYGVAALLFAVVAAWRFFTTPDTMAFAHLSMAVGLVLVALRTHEQGVLWSRPFILRFLPEFFLFVGLWLYLLHFLGW